MKYLKQFLCGANILTILPFYLAVYYSKDKNYGYFEYTLIAPFWFGLWNIISYIIAQKFNLTNNQRFIGISILTSLIVMITSTYFKTYNNTKKEWLIYYIGIFIKYMLIWNLIIRTLENNL
jgi:hypothetical protein